MKGMLKSGFIVFVLFVFNGCVENELANQDNIVIQYGTECGWCAGTEYITLTGQTVTYERIVPCGEEKGTTKKSRELIAIEWERILSLFDFQQFKKLKYNTCNICVDGCDEIIKLSVNGESHEIRYSPGSEISGIIDFQQILNETLIKMRESN